MNVHVLYRACRHPDGGYGSAWDFGLSEVLSMRAALREPFAGCTNPATGELYVPRKKKRTKRA